jgi:hypothetical protein
VDGQRDAPDGGAGSEHQLSIWRAFTDQRQGRLNGNGLGEIYTLKPASRIEPWRAIGGRRSKPGITIEGAKRKNELGGAVEVRQAPDRELVRFFVGGGLRSGFLEMVDDLQQGALEARRCFGDAQRQRRERQARMGLVWRSPFLGNMPCLTPRAETEHTRTERIASRVGTSRDDIMQGVQVPGREQGKGGNYTDDRVVVLARERRG